MRIAVMGAGGVGGCLAALLARDGNDVAVIARGLHLDAIRSRGLRLKQDNAEFTVTVPATSDPREVGPVDLVLYTVKTYHNAGAIPAVHPLVGPGTAVLTLQNGVECHLQLSESLGPGHALPGAYWTASSIESPGVVASIGPRPRLSFGEESGGITPRSEAIPGHAGIRWNRRRALHRSSPGHLVQVRGPEFHRRHHQFGPYPY